MKDLKIGIRLGVAFAVILTVMVALAAIAYQRIGGLHEQIVLLVEDKFPETVLANEIILAAPHSGVALRVAALAKDESAIKKQLDRLPVEQKEIDDSYAALKKTVRSSEGKAMFKRMTYTYSVFNDLKKLMIQLLASGRRDEATVLFSSDIKKASRSPSHAGAISFAQ